MKANMFRHVISALSVLLVSHTVFAAGVAVEPTSYSKSVNNKGLFIFVQFGNIRIELENGSDKQKRQFVELRETFPKPGLYKNADTMELVWETKLEEFVPRDHAMISDDGVYMVRIEGEFWRTESFPGGIRPTESTVQKQLDGPAVSFFKNGQLTKRYMLREFVENPYELHHSPEHLLWYASGSLNEASGRFVMYTQESVKYAFDYKTGEILEKSPVGLANPLMRQILFVCGGMSVLIAGAWAIFVYRRRVPDSVREAQRHG